MNTRKLALALVAIPTLTVAACSGNSYEATPVNENSPQGTESNIQPIEMGEPFTITKCNGGEDCKVEVTFRKAILTETCPFGVLYDDIEAMDKKGTRYLTIEGEYFLKEATNNYSIAETDFTAVNADKVASDNLIAQDCEDPRNEETLDNPVDPGLKRRGKLVLAIPKDTEEVRFSPMWEPIARTIDVTSMKLEKGSGEIPGNVNKPSPSPNASANEQSTEEPYVVECLFGVPGPSRMSDGSIQNTDYCANKPGAQEQRGAESNAGLDPSKVPFANGGTCPAAECGYGTDPDGTPNRSSGEIQFEHGCREGYIDPEQCSAAGY